MANNVVGSNLKVPKKLTLKELTALAADKQPAIEDFAPDIEASAPVVNQPSSINSAAYASALSPEGTTGQQMIDSYRQALAEDTMEGQSQTATNLFGQARQNAMQQNVDPLMNILSNPNISDEQKRIAVGQVYDQNSAIYSPANILSTKALSTPTENIPNREEDETRYSMSGITAEMNAVKNGVQQVYNSAQSAVQPDLQQHIYDLGIGLLPFTKQFMLAKIRADQTGAPISAFVKTFLGGVGTSTEFLRNQIASLPPDQQISAAENIANIINTHSNILISKPVDEARRQFLQGVIGGEGYSGNQELVDNLGSWVDLTLAGGPLVKGLSKAGKFASSINDAVKAGGAISDNSKAAKAFYSDFEANYAAERAVRTPTPANEALDNIVPEPPYTPQNKNSLGQFLRSREKLVYDSSTGVPYRKMPAENVLSSAIRDSIRSRVQPVSVYQNLKDTNVSMARDAYESMTLDDSGEAAQALAGTTRADALGSAMMPEVPHLDGSVANKIAAPDAIAQTRDAVPADIMDFIKHDGLTQYMQAEKAAARSWKVNQFQEAVGMTPRQEMFQVLPDLTKFTDTPQGFSFRGVYGPQNNGFSNAEDALETARFALRNTGIDESALGLLRREGANYVPTTLDELRELKAAGETKFGPATSSTGVVNVSAKSSKGASFDLVDKPTTMDTSGYGLKDGQWIREVTAHDPNSGDEIGRLIYTNYGKPPSVRVNPEFQRKGVATGMLKLAKQQGGTLGEDATGKFANGEVASRTNEGQAFRSNNNPDDVHLTRAGEGTGVLDDYLVTVDHNYTITPQDITEANGWQPLQVKLNFFDRWVPLGGSQGTFSNILFDPQSMLDKTIVAPAVVGIDRAAAIEKSLLRQIGDFSESWKKLGKTQQQVALNEIHEANLLSRDYNYNRLAASGASAETIDTIGKFKDYWDGVWHLKNHYFAKQLDKAGYEEFVHAGTSTNLPVRRVSKASVSGGVNVYDSATDTIKNLSKADVDALYTSNGGVAKLRQPILTQGGDVGEYVVHTLNAADGYLRKFTPNSQVLNYRPGYYGVDYKDPFHIIEKVKDAKGNTVYEHSIATAKDTKAAQVLADRMNAQGPNEFYYRKDVRLNNESRFEHEFDINQAQGMSSFRRRGKLLEDSTSNVTNLSNTHVRNPIETMVGQAIPLSKKIAMQDVTDAIKQRAIQQYSDFLPKGEFGQPLVPNDMRKIKYRGGVNESQSAIADARTTFGYANYLEHNYVNLLDDGMKAVFNNIADVIGKFSGKGEELTRDLADKSLTRGLRSASYYAYLGLSPLRQLFVQGHQAVMLAALNGKWLASSKAFSQPAYLALRTLGMDTNHIAASSLARSAWGDIATAERVFKQFQRTGLGAAVDHQNLVSGAVNDLAANMIANSRDSIVGQALKVPHKIASVSRKIGFDAGEFYNGSMSWLAHRDLAEKQGLNVFADDVADKVAGAARNYTGNMNTAGDLASNRNALSLVFQYTQNTQKLLLNLTTNRAIPWQLKLKAGILATMLFGTGSTIFLNSKTLNSIQNPDAREALQNGVEGWFLNKSLSLATGQKSEIDWSGLSPYNAYGTLDMIHGLFTTNLGEIVANSPSLSMFFGNNPRVTNVVKDMARYTNLIDDYQEPTTFLQVAKDFASISSGMSAYFKAAYLMKTRQKISSSGRITEDNVDTVNAIGAILGFPTLNESTMNMITQKDIQNRKDVEDDFNEWYRLAKQHYANPDLNGTGLAHTQKMLTEFYRVYGNSNPVLQRMMNQRLQEDMKLGDASMYNMVMRNCPLYNKGDCINLIDATPFSDPNEKQNLKDLLIFGNQFQGNTYDNKDSK